MPSIRSAPPGSETDAPTAAILPSWIKTVPFSMTAPETVTIRAFVIAKVPALPMTFCCEPSLCAETEAKNKPQSHRDTEINLMNFEI